MSYSQFGEEDHILRILDGIQGSFLDIGAWHPTEFSNTRALYERGWGGMLIEPSPACMLSLLEAYGDDPRIKLFQAAVMPATGIVKLHVSRDAVSTTNELQYAAWLTQARYDGCIDVPCISPVDLFARYGGDWEMISIDTEGGSVDVFAGMVEAGPRPRCVVVEHDSRFVELSQLAEKAHYRLVHENATNRVYEWTGRRE